MATADIVLLFINLFSRLQSCAFCDRTICRRRLSYNVLHHRCLPRSRTSLSWSSAGSASFSRHNSLHVNFGCGRYCLLFLPRDKLAIKPLDNVSPDVDELPFNLGIPLCFWFLAFGCHRSLLRSHTTEITPFTAVTMPAIVTATFMAR